MTGVRAGRDGGRQGRQVVWFCSHCEPSDSLTVDVEVDVSVAVDVDVEVDTYKWA